MVAGDFHLAYFVNNLFGMELYTEEEIEILKKQQEEYLNRQLQEHKMAMQREAQENAQLIAGQKKNDKVGRNEPCPCGSGKKYKHCHG